MKKRRYTKSIFQSIDWPVINKAGNQLTKAKKMWLMKYSGKYNATWQQLLKQKYWKDSQCPRCHFTNEESQHVHMCPDDTAKDHLADGIYKLELEMDKIQIHPIIKERILNTLFDQGESSFVTNVPLHTSNNNDEVLEIVWKAAPAQDNIEFHNIYEGHLAIYWVRHKIWHTRTHSKKIGLENNQQNVA